MATKPCLHLAVALAMDELQKMNSGRSPDADVVEAAIDLMDPKNPSVRAALTFNGVGCPDDFRDSVVAPLRNDTLGTNTAPAITLMDVCAFLHDHPVERHVSLAA